MELGAHEEELEGRTFGDLARRWLEVAHHEPSTRYNVSSVLDRWLLPVIGDVEVDELGGETFDHLYAIAGEELAPSTVRRIHRLAVAILEQGIRWEWIDRNPAKLARPPAVRVEPWAPSRETVLALIAQATTEGDLELEVFVRLAAVTGARRGELCALRRDDLELAAGTLTIWRSVGLAGARAYEKSTKTGGRRTVALDTLTVERLWRLLNGRAGSYVFTELDGRPWRPQTVSRRFSRLVDRAGVGPVKLHSLRHFCATQLLSAGMPATEVARRLGHSSPVTTLTTYGASIPHDDRKAAGLMGEVLA